MALITVIIILICLVICFKLLDVLTELQPYQLCIIWIIGILIYLI